MSHHSCCSDTSSDPRCNTIGARANDGSRHSLVFARWCLDSARWLVPSAILMLLPKCPACLAAYVAMGTGVGLSLSAATQLRVILVALCLASLSYLVARHMPYIPHALKFPKEYLWQQKSL